MKHNSNEGKKYALVSSMRSSQREIGWENSFMAMAYNF